MRNGLHIAALLGCVLACIGIAGGASDTLRGDAPLFLAGFGVVAVYCSLAILAAIGLWRLNKDL